MAFRNVFGRDAKTSIGNWIAKDFPSKELRRTKEWYADVPKDNIASVPQLDKPESGVEHPSDPKHTEIVNASLIRISLWDDAEWHGAMYAIDHSHSSPSAMALVFRKMAPAQNILQTWHNDLGFNDPEDKLRLTIVRGIKQSEPFTYRILIGTNLDNYLKTQKGRFWATANRSLVVNPTDNENLDGFLRSFRRFGVYFLTYVCRVGSTPIEELPFDIYIVKKTIHVREAWSIGIGDIDHMGIMEDDDPIIPRNVVSAPVLELIAQHKARAGA